MNKAWIAIHLEQFDLNSMCLALNTKKSSYFSRAAINQEVRQLNRHPHYKRVEGAFYSLKKCKQMGLNGYLYRQNKTVFSRRRISHIMSSLSLIAKIRKKFKKVSLATINNP